MLTCIQTGFGHICVSVDDLDAACKRFEEKGVSWKKRLTDGRMKNVAFVLDPDGMCSQALAVCMCADFCASRLLDRGHSKREVQGSSWQVLVALSGNEYSWLYVCTRKQTSVQILHQIKSRFRFPQRPSVDLSRWGGRRCFRDCR